MTENTIQAVATIKAIAAARDYARECPLTGMTADQEEAYRFAALDGIGMAEERILEALNIR